MAKRKSNGNGKPPSSSMGEALALVNSLPSRDIAGIRPTKEDRQRWFQYRTGMTKEEIATREGVDLDIVDRSIQRLHVYFAANSHEVVDAKVNSVALDMLDDVPQLLRAAMEAQKLLGMDDKGKPIMEPDHDTRLKIIDIIGKLIEKVRPKGGGVTVNNSNNQLNVNATLNDNRGSNLEAIVRKVREADGILTDTHATVINYDPAKDKGFVDETEVEEKEAEEADE